jgi:hypothetical protein
MVVMAKKVKMPLADGRLVDGIEVDVDESLERWSDVKLTDGTVLRVKLTVASAIRAENEYDPLGQPLYSLNMSPNIVVMSIPDNLRKTRN